MSTRVDYRKLSGGSKSIILNIKKSSFYLDKTRKRNIIYMKNIINCEDIVQVYNVVIKK